MSKIPPGMRRNNRHVDPHFYQDEFLYRRIPLALWENAADPVEVNAIKLPDISVGRSKYGHPEWLRLDKERYFEGWGVIGFQIQDIPAERWHEGVFHFTFTTFHDPADWNYPHAEVRAFENNARIDLEEKLPEDVHLKWRELLLRETKIFLKPHQSAKIRTIPPVSHKPELPIPPEDSN